jgi:hypothetical protein
VYPGDVDALLARVLEAVDRVGPGDQYIAWANLNALIVRWK